MDPDRFKTKIANLNAAYNKSTGDRLASLRDEHRKLLKPGASVGMVYSESSVMKMLRLLSLIWNAVLGVCLPWLLLNVRAMRDEGKLVSTR